MEITCSGVPLVMRTWMMGGARLQPVRCVVSGVMWREALESRSQKGPGVPATEAEGSH